MRVVVGWQGSDRNAARTNTMSRFETETLTQEDNLKGLALMNPQWVELAMAHTPHRRVILDMDSSESPVHGQQEGAAYNGHFECVCYHPLFLFNQFGDCEGATLRSGNVSSADGWQELLEPVVKGYQKKGLRLGVGQLSESDAVDALRLPFYSSSHPTGSHGWRNQFDLGNPDLRECP